MSEVPKPSRKLYYGWFVVAICMLALMLAIGSTMHVFGLYVVPVSKELSLSRASVNTGLILINAGAAVSALVVGRLLDRFSARLLMCISGLVLAISLVTLGLSRNLWLSAALLSFPVGFAIAGIGTQTAPALVARWFTIHRGRAMAITMMGISGGTIVVVPAVAWMIDVIGWRQSLIALGGFVGIALLVLSALVRDAPGLEERETLGAAPSQATTERDQSVAPLRLRQIWALPRFWGIALSTAVATASLQALVVSLVPNALDAGHSTTTAASLISALGAAGISGKFLVAWAGDRFDRSIALACLFAVASFSSALLLIAGSYQVLFASSVFAGFSAGATLPLYLALLADEFGADGFGTVNGNMTFIASLFGALAVRCSGEVYDRFANYMWLYSSLSVLCLFSTLLMLGTRRWWSIQKTIETETVR